MSPIYEYVCQACGFDFEAFRRIANRDMTSCPKCDAKADRRMSLVNHTFGFRLTERSHERFGPKEEFERDI